MTRAERRAAEQAALERQADTSWHSSPATGALPTARPRTSALPTTAGASAWERVEVSTETPPALSAWRERAARFAPNLSQAPDSPTAVQPDVADSTAPRRTASAGAALDPSALSTTAVTSSMTTGTATATEATADSGATDVTADAAPAGSSTPFPTRRQLSHAARHVTRLGRGNAARLLLLTVVTALAVEMIRASGPCSTAPSPRA